MPTTYRCDQCDWQLSIGSSHGHIEDRWYNAVYCRECGTNYVLEQLSAQFLDGFGTRPTQSTPQRFVLTGDAGPMIITVDPEQEPPTVHCDHCGASGPFGNAGPITDHPPVGLTGDWLGADPEARGACPRCAQTELRCTGGWFT